LKSIIYLVLVNIGHRLTFINCYLLLIFLTYVCIQKNQFTSQKLQLCNFDPSF